MFGLDRQFAYPPCVEQNIELFLFREDIISINLCRHTKNITTINIELITMGIIYLYQGILFFNHKTASIYVILLCQALQCN